MDDLQAFGRDYDQSNGLTGIQIFREKLQQLPPARGLSVESRGVFTVSKTTIVQWSAAVRPWRSPRFGIRRPPFLPPAAESCWR